MIREIAGMIIVIWGYLDGYKYHLEARKIREVKTARGHSRKFINIALGNDLTRFFYFIFIDKNVYVLLTTIIALVFMIEMWLEIYKYYPYRYKHLKNFKRPNVVVYFINSLLPNSIRKKL
jgi:hypothetical protein